eukprot:201728-Prymnesium_polylepis.1
MKVNDPVSGHLHDPMHHAEHSEGGLDVLVRRPPDKRAARARRRVSFLDRLPPRDIRAKGDGRDANRK